MSGAWLRRKVRHPWDGGPRLRVFVIPLKQQREIEHRVCMVGRGSERTAQTIDTSF
jgi:hypothetical protein